MNTSFSKTYHPIDVATWKRKEHFEKWIQFDEPFHGVVQMDRLNKQYAIALRETDSKDLDLVTIMLP